MDNTASLSRASAAAYVGTALAGANALAFLHPPTPGTRTFRWYRSLDKPSLTPPDPIFGIAWPIIQTGLAWGGYRLLRSPESPARTTAMALWTFNIGMIGGWSELFFGGKKLGASAIGSAVMFGTGAAFTAVAAKVDRKAAATGVPFTAWLGFATYLAVSIWKRNRPEQG